MPDRATANRQGTGSLVRSVVERAAEVDPCLFDGGRQSRLRLSIPVIFDNFGYGLSGISRCAGQSVRGIGWSGMRAQDGPKGGKAPLGLSRPEVRRIVTGSSGGLALTGAGPADWIRSLTWIRPCSPCFPVEGRMRRVEFMWPSY
jgi:hypothetical protein